MIHTIIKEERRKAPRQLAIEINNDLHTQTGLDKDGMPVFSVTPRDPQLHTIGEKITDYSNILYAAEWNGTSPYINVLKNELPDGIKMAYAGWPMITREEYEELYPPADNNLS
jgi:hypothetical protein